MLPLSIDCENNRPRSTDAPSSTSILSYASEHLRLRGFRHSRASSGQTCNRRVQTRQTLIHMSKEQMPTLLREPAHARPSLIRLPNRTLNAHTISFSLRDDCQLLWRWTVSNRRPPACKAGALPLSYTPRRHKIGSFLVLFFKKEQKAFFLKKEAKTSFPYKPVRTIQIGGTLFQGGPPKSWWAREDLNLRPHAYQACALTS